MEDGRRFVMVERIVFNDSPWSFWWPSSGEWVNPWPHPSLTWIDLAQPDPVRQYSIRPHPGQPRGNTCWWNIDPVPPRLSRRSPPTRLFPLCFPTPPATHPVLLALWRKSEAVPKRKRVRDGGGQKLRPGKEKEEGKKERGNVRGGGGRRERGRDGPLLLPLPCFVASLQSTLASLCHARCEGVRVQCFKGVLVRVRRAFSCWPQCRKAGEFGVGGAWVGCRGVEFSPNNEVSKNCSDVVAGLS